MRNVKIAAIQMQCSTNLQTNLEKAEKMVRQAAGDGAQIILLPELFERFSHRIPCRMSKIR